MLGMVARAKLSHDGEVLRFDCPGCGFPHIVNVRASGSRPGEPIWDWNGSLEAPTLKPSIHGQWTEGPERAARCCHSFVTGGWIQFLADCTHAMAGQTVDLPEIMDRVD